MAYTRILSLDGGGIRGIIPAMLLIDVEHSLQKLTDNPNARLSDYFDLIAGTSTGGILTCIYLFKDPLNPSRSKFTAEDALSFYIDHGKQIFKTSLLQKIRSCNGLFSPRYSSIPLQTILEHYFKNTLLSELLKPCLITAYDILNQKTTFFNQIDPLKKHKDDFYIKDIARATSAAPTYFPTAQVESLEGNHYIFIDGGVFANNPTMCAFTEASKITTCLTPSKTLILSIGCGYCQTALNTSQLNDGSCINWSIPIFNIFSSASSDTVAYQMKTLFSQANISQHYLRIEPPPEKAGHDCIPFDLATDDTLKALVEIGEKTTFLYHTQLLEFCKLLIQS